MTTIYLSISNPKHPKPPPTEPPENSFKETHTEPSIDSPENSFKEPHTEPTINSPKNLFKESPTKPTIDPPENSFKEPHTEPTIDSPKNSFKETHTDLHTEPPENLFKESPTKPTIDPPENLFKETLTIEEILQQSYLENPDDTHDIDTMVINDILEHSPPDLTNSISNDHITQSLILSSQNRKRIHFILPGGGVKGGFQAGFLYHLMSKYSHLIEIAQIDGTSVGAVNGLALLSGKIQILKDNWFSISTIHDLFAPWSEAYLFGPILSMYYAFYGMGLYNNQRLLNRLFKYTGRILPTLSEENLSRFNCVVVNVNNAKTEYISGNHPHIFQFITASASPWIISNPMKIENTFYTDGGITETYPLHNVDKINADLHVVVGCDQSHFDFQKPNFKNIGEYMATLIDIMRFNSHNTEHIKQLIEQKKVIPIVNTMKISLADFNPASIREGFTQGELCAEDFANIYLLS